MTLTDPADIKALLQRHGFRFSKAMGQNFLINPSVCPRMGGGLRRSPRAGRAGNRARHRRVDRAAGHAGEKSGGG